MMDNNNTDVSFDEYIKMLGDNLAMLEDYREVLGYRHDGALDRLRRALKDSDPFVVFNASIAASGMFNDKMLYH